MARSFLLANWCCGVWTFAVPKGLLHRISNVFSHSSDLQRRNAEKFSKNSPKKKNKNQYRNNHRSCNLFPNSGSTSMVSNKTNQIMKESTKQVTFHTMMWTVILCVGVTIFFSSAKEPQKVTAVVTVPRKPASTLVQCFHESVGSGVAGDMTNFIRENIPKGYQVKAITVTASNSCCEGIVVMEKY